MIKRELREPVAKFDIIPPQDRSLFRKVYVNKIFKDDMLNKET